MGNMFYYCRRLFFNKEEFWLCFQIKQRLHFELFKAFQLLFNTTRKITIENKLYAQFGVSSKKDIQTVIDFFSGCEECTLLGNKQIQYKNWLMHLKSSKRYSKLNFAPATSAERSLLINFILGIVEFLFLFFPLDN